ncbi:indoleacetamide hydrolase [Nitratireductor sp. XY-223]|uniref:indoleacetamide hydrolase n=1 Tax=Nitratireductor sp. XY-223 TaxID=2561926 RepID=UPI00197F7651|nr:indoleacetamide hydrolase [Nitratireductor sp. XY-223]
MSRPDPVELTITEALSEMREGKLSSSDYVEAHIDRCEKHADLNAVVSHDWDALRRAARATDEKGNAGQGLAGIPLVLKDNINTSTLPTSAATGALRGWVAGSNAPIAEALFAEGALLGAKGNMHELAFGITTNNAVTGASRNPFNRQMIPGGSSGGVGTAVGARLMPGGIGTDTGASVRLPAALCGIVGYRPTVGRYSGTGIVPISHTRDTAGPMVRSVADARLLDAVMSGCRSSGETADLDSVRIGVPKAHFYDDLDPHVAEIAERTLEKLGNAGARLVDVELPDIAALNDAVGFPVALYEFKVDLADYLARNGLSLTLEDIHAGVESPDVKGVMGSQLGDEAIPEALYRQVMSIERPKLQKAYETCFAENGIAALLFPTAPLPARPIGEDETVELNGARVPTFTTFIRNTDPASNAGIPGISLPAGLTAERLPVGMELDGPAGSDEQLLAIAAAVEAVLGPGEAPKL